MSFASISLFSTAAWTLYETRSTSSIYTKGLYSLLMVQGLMGVLDHHFQLPNWLKSLHNWTQKNSTFLPLMLINQDLMAGNANNMKMNSLSHLVLPIANTAMEVLFPTWQKLDGLVGDAVSSLMLTSTQKEDYYGIGLAVWQGANYFAKHYYGFLNLEDNEIFNGVLCGLGIFNHLRLKRVG